ncbi:hypothetical protein [Massilia pseudoviolaceinigra]|uniref:hypothetical protein n=1 Tax=Massilia pseudoviolaceinigra TaxID=3057165 RepID=UPI0027964C91|nr:hypothetical protein [Massilia sp. CCM 9206]MDQ1920305.1 hypothetical protein [Massilia sp. CCM 9206]
MTQQQEQSSQTQAAPAPDADALGALTASYEKGVPNASVIWCGVALLFAFGLFIIRRSAQNMPATAPDGAQYVGYAIGVVVLALSLASGLLIRRLMAEQPATYLFEHGIRTCNRYGEQTVLYCDIEDMLSYSNRAVAFRISPRAPWIFLGYFPDQFAVLNKLYWRHRVERSVTLLQQALLGETVRFRYFQNMNWRTKKMLNTPTSELTLNKQQLKIGNKCIDVDRIGNIDISFWTGKKTIMNKDGTVFHTMPMNAVLSFDVLYDIIICLQQLQSPQPGSQ